MNKLYKELDLTHNACVRSVTAVWATPSPWSVFMLIPTPSPTPPQKKLLISFWGTPFFGPKNGVLQLAISFSSSLKGPVSYGTAWRSKPLRAHFLINPVLTLHIDQIPTTDAAYNHFVKYIWPKKYKLAFLSCFWVIFKADFHFWGSIGPKKASFEYPSHLRVANI